VLVRVSKLLQSETWNQSGAKIIERRLDTLALSHFDIPWAIIVGHCQSLHYIYIYINLLLFYPYIFFLFCYYYYCCFFLFCSACFWKPLDDAAYSLPPATILCCTVHKSGFFRSSFFDEGLFVLFCFVLKQMDFCTVYAQLKLPGGRQQLDVLYFVVFYPTLYFAMTYVGIISHASVQHDFNRKPSAMQKNIGLESNSSTPIWTVRPCTLLLLILYTKLKYH
jgi:hypothetical protein